MALIDSQPFLRQLEARAEQAQSLVCIGLDPQPDLLTHQEPEAARDLCFRLIEQTHELACAFKPNSAFFEAFGAPGFEMLREVIAYVPQGIPVILDAKRGDVSATAEAYARAAFEVLGADAITLHPYLGYDAVEPFLQFAGKGVFVVCKTSSPGSDLFQNVIVGGRPFYELVARQAMQWDDGSRLGLLVSAIDPEILGRLRAAVPQAWFLTPGVGAGGDMRGALRSGLREDGMGMLINLSRSVARARDPRMEVARVRETINAGRMEPRSVINPEDRALDQLAGALAASNAVTLAGDDMPIALDMRALMTSPDALRTAAGALGRALGGLRFDHIAAGSDQALPITTIAALIVNASLIYGTGGTVEGLYTRGQSVALIDPVAGDGRAQIEMIERFRAAGLIVSDVVTLVDREMGAAQSLQAVGVRFHAAATLHQLIAALARRGLISIEQQAYLESYLAGNMTLTDGGGE